MAGVYTVRYAVQVGLRLRVCRATLCKTSMNGSGADTEFFGDSLERIPFSAEPSNFPGVHFDISAAEFDTFCLRISETSANSLGDQAALQFGNSPENGESHFPDCG